jgi:UDP-N-acetylglucosamine--N-acetylmuramyl-(pentapeptide) pyrophosphoryl-undecaprenol N-acetylglucosamine transferase
VSTRPLRVLLAGGGSGGSATPVLAVAEELRRTVPGVELLYVGTEGGPEGDLARAAKIPYAAVATGKLRRYLDWRNLVDPFRVFLGVWQAYQVARQFRPHVAFSAGGFAAVPPMIGARLAGARVLVHQQDVEPGLANRMLAPFAHRVTVSLESSLSHFPRGKTELTGNPVRHEILEADPERAYRALNLSPVVPIVVATGGGTGALGLNRIVAAAAPKLVEHCQLIHLTGKGRGVDSLTDSPRYRQIEFLVQEMPDLLAASTLVVTRAGLGTITELAALAKPSLLIPMPQSHQWANARAVSDVRGTEVADQESLTADSLAQKVITLLRDENRRELLGWGISQVMPRDATQRVAQVLLKLAA